MSTPPFDPNDRPQDQPRYPAVPGQDQPPYPGQDQQYPGQPGQYPGQPGQYPGQGSYPGQQQPPYPGQYGGQPSYPNQPGGWGPQGPAQPGYNPYSPSGGYGFNYAPPGELAGWGSRVGAYLLDYLVAAIPLAIGWVLALVLSADSEELGSGGGTAVAIGYLGFFGVQIWNRVIQQGRTGQSLGKRVVGLKVVAPETGQLIGMGRTLGREVCAVVFNNICFLNLLWPLWDERRQTWHDKVASDIVIKL